MHATRTGMRSAFGICVASLLLLVAVAESATVPVDCDTGGTITESMMRLKPGDTLLVIGTCRENVVIPSDILRITLDGQGKAAIAAPGDTMDGIFIRGREIVIRGLTITGGRDGVHLSGAAAGASAVIDGNTIHDTGRGVHLDSGSLARIVNNRIYSNRGAGIDVNESSSARVGFILPQDPLGRNSIENNGGDGIMVSRNSNAWIVGNLIADNRGSGIAVNRASQVDALDNTISGNARDGISVNHNSGVNLRSEGTARQEGPNRTDTSRRNSGFGIRCAIGGYVDGPLGTLAGMEGSKDLDATCIDRVTVP